MHLELGGNSALIVLDDVDLEKAVSVGAFGLFNHAGQICMATSRHLVSSIDRREYYAAALAEHARPLPVGDPTRDDVALGPDHRRAASATPSTAWSPSRVDAGAHLLAAGGTYEGLFYRPDGAVRRPRDAPPPTPGDLRAGRSRRRLLHPRRGRRAGHGTEYGLSLGILTRDVMRGLALAERIPSGLVHINDQTVNDEALIPFGGVGESGTGSRHGGTQANLDAFTEVQWVTVRGDLPQYPFCFTRREETPCVPRSGSSGPVRPG